MNKSNGLVNQIKIGLAVALLAALTGCVGYVDGGGGYGGTVVVPGPDVVVYGGGFYGGGVYERGHDVHGYSDRGSVSRAAAHRGGGGGRGGKR
jgi:hypothetical protein